MRRDLASGLVVGLSGAWPTATEAAWLAHWQPAGVILFSRNVRSYNSLYGLCCFLHELVPGLEIMADHEGGPVSQLAGAVGRPPVAWGLGVLDDVGLTARVFQETGQRLSQAGIDRVLAPVADVLTEVRNPVIGARSFGPDPALVARHTVAAVTGLLTAGVQVCLKHWPGHGGSLHDSHVAETTTGRGAVPVPFESGLTAGADAVMVGHLLTEADGELTAGLPATLDENFLASSQERLALAAGHHPLFFADDVTMGALGPAMERLGVAVPDTEASGLFDPGSLPAAWFAKLTGSGCRRLLIRGLPLKAFPLEKEPGLSFPEGPAGESRDPDFNNGPYTETRQRLWQRVGADFRDPDADLLWLDFSRDDRWQAAAGLLAGPQENGGLGGLQNGLTGMFRSVRMVSGQEPVPGRFRRLLVTSHRPVPAMAALDLPTEAQGVCLAMGHPSLQADLEGLLGAGWQVGALYDIAPEDLI